MKFEIYTDGSCYPNGRYPNKGSWAFTVFNAKGLKLDCLGGKADDTTCNRMELLAFIYGVEWANKNMGYIPVTFFSDSRYLVNGYNRWMKKTGVYSNMDLWKRIFKLRRSDVSLQWIKGHNGNIGNEAANDLAEKLRKI